jgi:hypothetical protein
MGRELRIVGFVVLATIAFSVLATYNKQAAKPIPVPLPLANDSKPEPPRTVRVIQIYKKSDQLSVETTTARVLMEPISAFPETATIPLPETLPSSLPTPPSSPPQKIASLPTPPPPQKTAIDFCARFHLHKVFTNNGKSWRCMK